MRRREAMPGYPQFAMDGPCPLRTIRYKRASIYLHRYDPDQPRSRQAVARASASAMGGELSALQGHGDHEPLTQR